MHYINGHWQLSQGQAFNSINPATGAKLWRGQMATALEINAAVAAAAEALPLWSTLPVTERAEYLLAFAAIVEKNQAILTKVIAEESGKPLWEAKTESSSVIAKVKLSIQSHQERLAEKTIPMSDATGVLQYKPHGIVAVLGPFNFPAHLSNGHIVPALLAGNTVIYKPSELTPKVAETMLRFWDEAKLPAGVLNGIQGDATVAKALLKSPIHGVFFTGSYQTGLHINQLFSTRPEVILALEMGGNNPLVLTDVHDLDAALYHSLLSTFITAGQRCSCARRLIIPNTAFGTRFLNRFIELAQSIHINAFDAQPEPFMGPIIREQHALAHLNTQEKLIHQGGKPLLKMASLQPNTGFLSPGIMDMSQTSFHFDEEIFAPFVQIYRYHDFKDAIALANQTQYGLAAGLLSDDPKQFAQFYQHVRAGLINWNRPTTGAASQLPFGGLGHSGNYRPSAYFAADYCAYPIASLQQEQLILPSTLLPGIPL